MLYSTNFLFNWGVSQGSSSVEVLCIKFVYKWGHVSLSSYFVDVTFYWGHLQYVRLPLRLSTIEVVFHWGWLPFRLYSIEAVFQIEKLSNCIRFFWSRPTLFQISMSFWMKDDQSFLRCKAGIASHSFSWAWHSSAPACLFHFLYEWKFFNERLPCIFLQMEGTLFCL
jgi:hypothetical protein